MSIKFSDLLFERFFNQDLKEKIENITIYVAGSGFIIHLLLVFLNMSGLIIIPPQLSTLFSNPIAAIYTPFSFILFYEVYLLIYYLPSSFSISIAKQYEIVSLILIRRIFKDISNLDFGNIHLFEQEYLNLVYDIAGFLLLFFLIFLFRYLLTRKRSHSVTPKIEGFIRYKRILCIILVPVFMFLSLYSFTDWIIDISNLNPGVITEVRDFNKIFYNEFFVALIIADVLILIASFRYTDRYSLLIRNTGFVITTVLIRISFSTSGFTNVFLLVSSVGFGVLVLYLYSLYDRIDKGDSTRESYAYL